MRVNFVSEKNINTHTHKTIINKTGKQELNFASMGAFQSWKEREEENTYSMYVKDQRSYQPKSMKDTYNVYILFYVATSKNMILGVINRHYYVCCRDGKYEENKKPRFTKAKRPNQRASRKLSGTCTSRIYVNEFCDGHVEATYIAGHTGHELGVCELPHLSLPASVKDTVAMKLSLGIPADRIMEGKHTRRVVIRCVIICVITTCDYRHLTRCRKPHKEE